jgi:hypothetical protein
MVAMTPMPWLSCLMFAGCMAAAAPAAPAAPAVTAAPRGNASSCPTGARLLEVARTAVPWLTADSGGLACRVIRAPTPSWLITLEATCGDAVVVIRDGAVVWSDGHEPAAGGTPCLEYSWDAADLDGDGMDELLERRSYQGHEGSGDTSLTVFPIADATAGSSVLPLSASSGFDRGWSCSSTVRLVDGPHGAKRIEVVGTISRPDMVGDHCPRPGRHTYAWRHGALEED